MRMVSLPVMSSGTVRFFPSRSAVLGGAFVAACAASPRAGVTATPAPRVADAPAHAVPIAEHAAGSIALARIGERTLAYVADEDDHAVHVVDVDASRAIGRAPLEGRPSQLLVSIDGRVLALDRDRGRLVELATAASGALEPRRETVTAAEPVALAETPDGKSILVASGWGHALEGFDAHTMARTFAIDLGREPRAIVIAPGGATAFVAHAVGGVVSAIDLASRRVRLVSVASAALGANNRVPSASKERASCQGFALATAGARILAPQVIVDPGDVRSNTQGYGDAERTEISDVAVLDAANGNVLGASLEGPDAVPHNPFRFTVDRHDECLLPRAAAFDARTESLLVACLGLDAVVAYDAFAASPARVEKRRWTVPAGPVGVAVDAKARRAIVWSQFDRAVTTIPLDDGELADDHAPAPLARVALPSPRSASPAFVLGRALFHAAGDVRVAKDGRACASCHPDGRDDALTWSTPSGPRRTIALLRVADRAPLSWSGGEKSLKRRILTTLQRLDGTGGLRGAELDALASYVAEILPPPARAPRAADVLRGREIFTSREAACAGCHGGTLFTDDRAHDVNSKTPADLAAAFNTPSLRFVGGTAPYFHDGRYATLADLLSGGSGTGRADAMGHTQHLSPADLHALEAFLESL